MLARLVRAVPAQPVSLGVSTLLRPVSTLKKGSTAPAARAGPKSVFSWATPRALLSSEPNPTGSAPSAPPIHEDPTILTSVAEANANVQAQVDALVQESGVLAVPVVAARQTVAHVFLRFDVRQSLFNNSISISLPETTPQSVMNIVVASLSEALKDRPDGLSFKNDRLPQPEFYQTGANWNRFQYTIAQREVSGALDPYVIQAIVLDALTNRADAKIVSSNSLGVPGSTESVTYVLTVNVQADCIDYNGTYRVNGLTEN